MTANSYTIPNIQKLHHVDNEGLAGLLQVGNAVMVLQAAC